MVLKAFHVSQQIVSMQKTPTLSAALPAYESLLSNLKTLKTVYPYLSHMLMASIVKIEEYVDKARSTHMYSFAMFVNPVSKTSWIEREWPAEQSEAAKTAILDIMTKHQTAIRHECAVTKIPNHIPIDFGGSDAAHSLNAGITLLNDFTESLNALSHSSSLQTISSESTINENNAQLEEPVDPTDGLTAEELEIEAVMRDRLQAQEEYKKWVNEGIITDREKLQKFDLVQFWDNQNSQINFPIIFQLALDVIPVQASAVPCERAFSSSKETDADQRS
ncbi:hypothetical protein D9758_011523 [Tetrapyrgos nigripes]|uniref:HAT C-terminal dimerisation domain-containing protein n=1 Tax=Tetrapyrgos nigripes TaxID=182062 RepID=A0A8H5CQV1_9AGAR|nr:hypothetical protein D9758_011523 [Tetrapyrgos nigripes]